MRTTNDHFQRRSRMRLAALAVAAAALVPTAALAANSKVKAHVLFSGGRTTNLRVGEPLLVAYSGAKIRQICWTPAPIDRPACSSAVGAAAAPGAQQLVLTLKSGKQVTTSLRIRAAATKLAPSIRAAAATNAHPVVLKAACDTKGYGNYDPRTKRFHDARRAYTARTGDQLAGYYRAGPHAIQAYLYRTNEAAFYPDTCLQPAP